MIQANELRIGNYLKGDELNIPRLNMFHNGFTKITAFGIQMISEGKITSLMPIPLTPEILIKCGFEEDGYEKEIWYQRDFPVIGELCTSDREHSLGNYLFDTQTDTLKIHYMHQLQNLYFALTGEELKIEL